MLCAIALGSNLGDRCRLLNQACHLLSQTLRPARPLVRSSVYASEPVDCPPGAPGFLNAVVLAEVAAEPRTLLDNLQTIERALGRRRPQPPNAPRPIDLDILTIGGLQLEEPRLVVPHPRLHQRLFVLLPLAEIAPDMLIPGHAASARRLLETLDSTSPRPQLSDCQLTDTRQ